MTNITTTQRVIDFAREHFFEDLADLLDDPSWLNHPENDITTASYAANLTALAADLGYDLNLEISKLGTEFERARLVKILRGV